MGATGIVPGKATRLSRPPENCQRPPDSGPIHIAPDVSIGDRGAARRRREAILVRNQPVMIAADESKSALGARKPEVAVPGAE